MSESTAERMASVFNPGPRDIYEYRSGDVVITLEANQSVDLPLSTAESMVAEFNWLQLTKNPSEGPTSEVVHPVIEDRNMGLEPGTPGLPGEPMVRPVGDLTPPETPFEELTEPVEEPKTEIPGEAKTEPEYACSVCYAKMPTATGLRRHLKYKHEKV